MTFTSEILLGDALLAATAIFVAIIAAGTAQWRLRATLRAERRRLNRQLKHDRTMRELEDQRVVLDDATRALALAVDAVIHARTRISFLSTAIDEEESLKANEALRLAQSRVTGLRPMAERLRLRFGPGDVVYDLFVETRDALADWIGSLGDGLTPLTDQQEARQEQLEQAAADANAGLVNAGRSRLYIES